VRTAFKNVVGKLKGRDHFGNLGVGGKIILK
jgi:hypothetical protein